MIKLIIADDHPLVREGLKKILKEESSIQVIAEAQNALELMELLQKEHVDLVILDISMPGITGLEVLKDLKQRYPKLPILILSMHPEDRFAVRALRGGAAGYVTKESAPDELVNAIRRIYSGKKYISASVGEQLATIVDDHSDKLPHELLSDREYQVLYMIASGRKVSQIAEELSLSVHTINTYRSRIMEKLNLESNVQLTHYAIKHKLVD